jgi:hypothetical protein
MFVFAVTTPSGDIILEEGNPLKINCTIDRTHPSARGRNSSNLVFFQDNREVPAKYVTTINETTIQLTVENLAMSNYIYYCKLRTEYALEPVCLNSVIVGSKYIHTILLLHVVSMIVWFPLLTAAYNVAF